MRNRHSLLTLLLVLPLSHCECPGLETELQANRKRIALTVCTTEPNINGKGGVDGCNVDFGLASLAERVPFEVTISNVGEIDLAIKGYKFSDSSDPSFSVEHYPDTLKSGVSSKMILSFRPLVESVVEADLVLITDAENAKFPGNGEVTIKIRGGGVDNGLPHLQVDVVDGDGVASCCDLGFVAKENVANCQLRLTNTGTRGLVLDEVDFVPEVTDGPWEPVGALPRPNDHSDDEQNTISPGEHKTISFRFKPIDLIQHQARVRIRSNAPRACGPVGAFDANMCTDRDYLSPCPAGQAGVVTVDLRGQGADPPLCVAKIKSVNGSSDFDRALIEPLDDVELSAEDSSTSQPDIRITAYKWTIVRRPGGSNVRFDSDTSATPRFAFDNSSTNIITGLDVAGEYEARCEVTDSRGTTSINDAAATVAFAATPSEAIHLQLVWDAPETDVDLHMVRERPAGTYNRGTEDDCYYANCKPGTSGPIWGVSPDTVAHEGGNPVLDVDDVQGYGPENSNIHVPVAGKYKALVHYFSDHSNGDTVATMRVYIYGNLVAEYTELLSDGQWWDVGTIDWPAAGAPVWTEIDTFAP